MVTEEETREVETEGKDTVGPGSGAVGTAFSTSSGKEMGSENSAFLPRLLLRNISVDNLNRKWFCFVLCLTGKSRLFCHCYIFLCREK